MELLDFTANLIVYHHVPLVNPPGPAQRLQSTTTAATAERWGSHWFHGAPLDRLASGIRLILVNDG